MSKSRESFISICLTFSFFLIIIVSIKNRKILSNYRKDVVMIYEANDTF